MAKWALSLLSMVRVVPGWLVPSALRRVSVNWAWGKGCQGLQPPGVWAGQPVFTAADQPPAFGPRVVRDRPRKQPGCGEVFWSGGCEGGCSHSLLSFLAFHSAAYSSG